MTTLPLTLLERRPRYGPRIPSAAEEMARASGFGVTDTLSALGAQWPISRKAAPLFSKESERIRQAEKRIARLKHLPSPLATKLELASSACLSLLDYINSPHIEEVRALRLQLKSALGHRFAAPEVLFHARPPLRLIPCLGG